jgi:leucyl aminopeptidase
MVTSTRPSSKWLEEKLASVPASKTVALIVDEAEVREQKLNCLSHLDSSKEFRQDLTLAKCVWIYTNDEAMRRILLIQYKATEARDGASDEQKKMAQLLNMRTLACTVVAALQARKTNDVEVIASSAIDADSLSAFMTGFDLTNYEWSQRGEVKLDEKKETEKDVDERLSKKSKSIDNFTFSHENDLSQNAACVYNKITADATKFARDLAQTRASHANPAWMEKQIRDLITAEKCE